MRVLLQRSLFIWGLGMVLACAQIGVPVENHSNAGYLDQVVSESTPRLKASLDAYLRARHLLESVHGDQNGNWYLHQAWVQSPSLRYYQLTFDRRKRHLSEWKAVWYLEPIKKSKTTKLRLAVLEILYLGDPDNKVRAPKEADGNWVETAFDLERAKLLYEDFNSWRITRKLSRPAQYLKTDNLDFAPKSKTEVRRGSTFMTAPWWFN